MSIGAIALIVTIVTAGVFAVLGSFHASRHTNQLEDYMVSRNRFGSWMAFSTIVASAMGVWILFSPPEVGATSGIAGIVGYCIGQAAPSALFSKIGGRIRNLMPNGHSLNEYVLYRFGNAMYGLTLLIIVFYMFVYLAAELTAIAKAVEIMGGVPLLWTALVVMAATFIYTIHGGLGTTIVTDAIQLAVIVPLLLVVLVVSLLSFNGVEAAMSQIQVNTPELLSFGNIPGVKFGATLVIAVLVAEVFNQGNWQRIYACRTNTAVQRAFLGSSLAILPMLFIAGVLGLLASQLGFTDDRAFFSLVQYLNLPVWFTVLVLVLALALVMSTLATLLNGISSVFTLDLIRLFPQMQTRGLLRTSRAIAVAISTIGVAIAAQGYNVLYLFLLADLVCAGAFVPILLGLYSRRLTGRVAFWSAVIGIAVGALFFPKPDFTPWINVPFAGDLLVSFIAPVVVSGFIIWVWDAIAQHKPNVTLFDFDTLKTQIRRYSDQPLTPGSLETNQ